MKREVLEIDGPPDSERLTKALVSEISNLLEKGHTLDVVLDYLEISSHLFFDWNHKGTLHLNGNISVDDSIYAFFITKMRRAIASYKISLGDDLHDKKNADWFRQYKILERRSRSTWGKESVDSTGEEDFNPDDRFL